MYVKRSAAGVHLHRRDARMHVKDVPFPWPGILLAQHALHPHAKYHFQLVAELADHIGLLSSTDIEMCARHRVLLCYGWVWQCAALHSCQHNNGPCYGKMPQLAVPMPLCANP